MKPWRVIFQWNGDANQRTNYYWDTNPFDGSYSQNAWGRVAAVEYSVDRGNSQSMPVVEMYSYAAAGAAEKKKLQYTISPFTQTLEAVCREPARGRRVSGTSRLSPDRKAR